MEDVCHRRTVVMRVKCSGKENRFSGGCDNDENELWRQERLWADCSVVDGFYFGSLGLTIMPETR